MHVIYNIFAEYMQGGNDDRILSVSVELHVPA